MFQRMTHFSILLTTACFSKMTVSPEVPCKGIDDCEEPATFCYKGLCKPVPATKTCATTEPLCSFVEQCERGYCEVKDVYKGTGYCKHHNECKYGFVCIDGQCMLGRDILLFPDCIPTCPLGFECSNVIGGRCYPKEDELAKLTKCSKSAPSCPDGKECQHFYCIPKLPSLHSTTKKTTTKKPDVKTTTTTTTTTTTAKKPDVKKTTARVTKKTTKKPHKNNEYPTFCGYPKFMVTAVFVTWFLGK